MGLFYAALLKYEVPTSHSPLYHIIHTDIAIQVEFLVRSHDCYTLGCSVDGK